MPHEIYYKIGGLNLRVAGGFSLDGFSQFRVECSANIDVDIICDCDNLWCEARELSRFIVDDVAHIFARYQGGYLFTLQKGEHSVTLRHQEGTSVVKIERCDDMQLFRFMLWVAFSLVALRCGVVPIHSSVIVCEGSGVLFLGESGAGKSTQSTLWLNRIEGCRALNDDSPILRVEGGDLVVYGSPWSGKTACYINECYRVKALVRVVKSDCNIIAKSDTIHSFAAIYPSLPPMFAFDEQLSDIMLDFVSKILPNVSTYTLRCTKDVAAAYTTYDAIYGKVDN